MGIYREVRGQKLEGEINRNTWKQIEIDITFRYQPRRTISLRQPPSKRFFQTVLKKIVSFK
ncbi:hypothetical protein DMA11_20615 [Marinilabiliaceae bacterium JC017]|nr:hypothetical protein DMA11_20615 [Marinilabiliaceae bacterium JC017]